jgi:pimeloyl-ACP methyl ester carboxylesterase
MAGAKVSSRAGMAMEQGFWQDRIGHQRSFIWRGLQVRYSFCRNVGRSPSVPNKSATPLVLIHGFGASIEHWRDWLTLAAGDRPVYAIDLLGFGGSRKAALPFGVPFWTEQVHYFLATVVGEPAIVVGNSIGSLVAAVLAQQYPDQVQAIALLSLPDIAQRQEMIPKPLRPILSRLEQLSMQPWLIRLIFNIARRRNVLKKALRLAYPTFTDISPELLDIIQLPTLDQDAEIAFLALNRQVNQPDFCPPMAQVLPQITCPILLLWGEKDRFVPPAIAPKLAQLNPNITLKMLPELGHCPQDEAPEPVYQFFTKWLGETLRL